MGVGLTVASIFCPALAPIAGAWWKAALIGAGTTMGLGVATGASWKQILFEGAVTFGIVAGISYGVEKGGLSSWVQGGSGSGISGGFGVGIPIDKRSDDDAPRVTTGESFPNQDSHRTIENAAPENSRCSDESTRRKSDRANPGSNFGNGAASDAFTGMQNSEHTFSERCKICFNYGLLHDPVAQTAAALTVSSIPFPKGSRPLGSKGITNIYSRMGLFIEKNDYIPGSIKSILNTDNALTFMDMSTTNILRFGGRLALPATATFTAAYSAGRMFRCVTEKWDQPGE